MQIQHLVTILNTVPHTFVPTDTLEHTKNCAKNTRKSADAVAGLQFLKGSECSNLFTTSKFVRVRIPRMMFFKFQRHSLISVSQCLASSQLISATLNTATAVRTSCMGTYMLPTLRVTR